MSPTSFHCAVATALLFVGTLCSAQSPATPPPASAPRTGGTVSSGPDGLFRPAASEEADQQRKTAQPPQQPPPLYPIGRESRTGANALLNVEILNVEGAKRTVR